MPNNKILILGCTLVALYACNRAQPTSLGNPSGTASSALQSEQSADAVIGQDFYDTNDLPMISGLGFGSLGDITNHETTLFVADPVNSRILLFEDAHTMASGSPATGVIGQTDAFHAWELDNSIVAGKMTTSEEGVLYVYNKEKGTVYAYLSPKTVPIPDYSLLDTPIPVKGLAALPNNLLAVAGENSIQFYSRSPDLTSPYHQATIATPCLEGTTTDLLFVDSSENGPMLMVACQHNVWVVALNSETYFPKKLSYESCTGSIGNIGNRVCDGSNNNQDCGWDGGDCCASTNPGCASPSSNSPCACQNPNACDDITCETPLAPWCEGSIAVSYDSTGTCTTGVCQYPEASRTDCGSLGQACNNGVCIDSGNPCENIGQCLSPPDSACDGNLAIYHPQNGACSIDGSGNAFCDYSSENQECSDSEECNFGRCVPKNEVENPADLRKVIFTGFYDAISLAIEMSNLYVLDAGANRVIYFEDIQAQLAAGSVSKNPTESSRIFGQPDADSTVVNYHNLNQGEPSDQGLANPTGLALLENHMQLWIADGNNFRVNRYDYTETDNFANRVLGQSDFSHNQANRLILRGFLGISTVEIGYVSNVPYSLIVDPISHRVVVHDNIETYITGNNPNEKVFGQSNISDYKPNRGGVIESDTLDTPIDVAVDTVTGKIAIADYRNQRVVVYDSKDSLSADQALGVTNLTSQGANNLGFQSLAIRNNQLFVAVSDYSVDGEGLPNSPAHQIFHYDLEQNESNFVKPQRVFGQAYDESTHVLPGNDCNRNNLTASHDTLCDITDLYVDTNDTLWVVDSGNNRVLWFDSPTDASQVNATSADGVVGQVDFQENSAWDSSAEAAPYQFKKPAGIGVDDQGALWVADRSSSRVLFFPAPKTKDPLAGMAKATAVIGNEMTAYGPKTAVSASAINSPRSLAVSQKGNILLVADNANNRVLRYTHNLAPIITGAGTYTVEAGKVLDVTIGVTDPEGDALDPISILENPIPSGISLNGDTLSFSTANQEPNTSTRVHLTVSDQSPRGNTAVAAVTFRIISKPRVYERGEPPAERPLDLPKKSGCTALYFPFEGLFLILLYATRRSVLRRRRNEQSRNQ